VVLGKLEVLCDRGRDRQGLLVAKYSGTASIRSAADEE
jgi:hypothetical protein